MRTGLLALVSVVSACSGVSTETSDIATTSAGHWRQAYVTITYTPAHDYRPLNSTGVHHVPNELVHLLTLVPVQTFNRNGVYLVNLQENAANRARLQSLRDLHYNLRFAADGKSIALSTNGTAWTIADLTWVDSPMEQPFWCSHRTASGLSPWPSMRAVALEVLAEASPTFSGVRIHTTSDRRPRLASVPGAVPADQAHLEFRGAILYACAHREDPVLRAAAIQAFAQLDPWSLRVPGDNSIAIRCQADLEHPASQQ